MGNRKKTRILACVLVMLLICAACGGGEASQSGKESTAPQAVGSQGGNSQDMGQAGDGADQESAADPSDNEANPAVGMDTSDMFSKRDYKTEYQEKNIVAIQLQGDTAHVEGNGVSVKDSTITIATEGTYILSGTLTHGQIRVEAGDQDKIQLVLDGATIHSETSAPICIMGADKVFITLAAGTENTLTNGGTFVAEERDTSTVDGTLFSKQDLTINGTGSLTIESPAGHGIVCKDDLVITGGVYTIHTAEHGLDINDSLRMDGGSMTIVAGKDGVHVENNDNPEKGFVYVAHGLMNITCEGDGISAGLWMQVDGGTFAMDTADDGIHSNASVIINGGTFEVASGGDGFHADDTLVIADGVIDIRKSYEGLEGLHILVSGGNISMVCTDDGLNAAGGTDESGFGGDRGGDTFGRGGFPGGAGGFGGGFGSANSDGSIRVTGGVIYAKAYGDGMDANGTLEISGGHVTICGPSSGDTATLDYDLTGVITGGTFIGTGGTMMAQSFSDASQGVFAVNVGTQEAGTQITLVDSQGQELFSYAPELDFAVVILSSPQMVKGETYTITVGRQSGTLEAQ